MEEPPDPVVEAASGGADELKSDIRFAFYARATGDLVGTATAGEPDATASLKGTLGADFVIADCIKPECGHFYVSVTYALTDVSDNVEAKAPAGFDAAIIGSQKGYKSASMSLTWIPSAFRLGRHFRLGPTIEGGFALFEWSLAADEAATDEAATVEQEAPLTSNAIVGAVDPGVVLILDNDPRGREENLVRASLGGGYAMRAIGGDVESSISHFLGLNDPEASKAVTCHGGKIDFRFRLNALQAGATLFIFDDRNSEALDTLEAVFTVGAISDIIRYVDRGQD